MLICNIKKLSILFYSLQTSNPHRKAFQASIELFKLHVVVAATGTVSPRLG